MKSNIPITIPNFEIENEFIDIQLPPGVYELIEINNTIKQIITDSGYELDDKSKFKKDLTVFSIEFNIIPDTISMKSVLTTSNPIHFNSELNKVLGFTQRDYPPGTRPGINKTRLDTIQFFLEDSNHDSVDFNGETLTFTIHIIKI